MSVLTSIRGLDVAAFLAIIGAFSGGVWAVVKAIMDNGNLRQDRLDKRELAHDTQVDKRLEDQAGEIAELKARLAMSEANFRAVATTLTILIDSHVGAGDTALLAALGSALRLTFPVELETPPEMRALMARIEAQHKANEP